MHVSLYKWKPLFIGINKSDYVIYQFVYVQKPLTIITTMAIMNNDDTNTDNIYISIHINIVKSLKHYI